MVTGGWLGGGGGSLEKMLTGASLLRGEEVGTSPDVWMPRKSLAVADSAVFSPPGILTIWSTLYLAFYLAQSMTLSPLFNGRKEAIESWYVLFTNRVFDKLVWHVF